ncbi:MAG: hypothetical protein K8L91_30230 [Anaerolineae bacterium]|nr:hypothetical protein [Anaerolineae bacterium]
MNTCTAKIRMALVMVVACFLSPLGQTGEASPARQSGAPTIVLTHNQYITEAAWSPDGRWILALTLDDTAHIWDTKTGVMVTSLPCSTSADTFWSPDSTRLVTWQDTKVWVWEVGTWGALAELNHDRPIVEVFWHWDGNQIAVLVAEETFPTLVGESENATGGEYHLWDITTGTKQITLPTLHRSMFSQFSWSYDSRYVASASIDEIALQVWDLAIGAEIAELRQSGSLIPFSGNLSATWSKLGNWLLITNIRGDAVVVDVQSQTTLFTLHDEFNLRKVVWNPSETLLVGDTAGSRRVPIWDGGTGEFLYFLTDDWLVLDVAWSQDGRYLLTDLVDGNFSSRLVVWDAVNQVIVASVDFDNIIFVPLWSANGSFAAGQVFSTDSYGEVIRVVRIASGETLLSFDVEDTVIWHPTENRLLRIVNADSSCTADCKYEVQIWDVQ